ncbi:MAG: outer-membrane lipoprotein carrier protein LolA, partial [Ignavibacteria bacterium]|nr:outer-membrane lipoprotein carrier protein LolA [Ignavibacteria bacterium]
MKKVFKVYRTNIIALFLVLILASTRLATAQNDPNQLLQAVQDKFNTLNDLSANLIQSINGSENLAGKVYYKKEDKIRFELTNILIVSDGETNWNYNEKENKVIISSYDEEDAGLLSIEHFIFDYPEGCELSTYMIDDQPVLKLTPQTSAFNFNSVKLWIADDNLVTRLLIDDPVAGLVQIDLTGYSVDKNLPDSKFTFTPPEGSKVIDL